MRPSLVPGLVTAAQNNANRGFADMALFEVGQIFKGDRPEDQFHRGERRAPRDGVIEGERPFLVRLVAS